MTLLEAVRAFKQLPERNTHMLRRKIWEYGRGQNERNMFSIISGNLVTIGGMLFSGEDAKHDDWEVVPVRLGKPEKTQ